MSIAKNLIRSAQVTTLNSINMLNILRGTSSLLNKQIEVLGTLTPPNQDSDFYLFSDGSLIKHRVGNSADTFVALDYEYDKRGSSYIPKD